jgi:hypothetical protein
MNNEPVAWIYDWGNEQDIKTKLFPNSKAKITPLYTHPADLTDDEIQEIWLSFKGSFKDFARAILRKAQER